MRRYYQNKKPAINITFFRPVFTGFRTRLTLLEPQSRSGDKPVKFQVVLSPNGTAVLKGLIPDGDGKRLRIIQQKDVLHPSRGVYVITGSVQLENEVVCYFYIRGIHSSHPQP